MTLWVYLDLLPNKDQRKYLLLFGKISINNWGILSNVIFTVLVVASPNTNVGILHISKSLEYCYIDLW